MSSIALHRSRALILAAAGSAVLFAGVVLLAGHTQTRSSVIGQLEQPAGQPRSGSHEFSATVGRRGLRMNLTLGLNRAGLRDRARLRLLGADGRPVTGAHVSLSYSMPSMNMWGVYSSRLMPVPRRAGSYGATEAALGMPGRWRITIAVTLPRGGADRFTVDDHMPA